jgi:predicted phosphodiesterase
MRFRIISVAVLIVSSLLLASFKINVSSRRTSGLKDTSWLKERKDKKLKICVISDLNSSYGSTKYSDDVRAVIGQLSRIKPDLIICAGDMVAGQKTSLSEQNIKEMWEGFKEEILTPIQNLKIPLGFTVGNHDASPGYLTDRALAKEFWTNAENTTNLTFVDSTHFPFYFSYIKNNVFIISWDAAGSVINPEIFNWMKIQLKGEPAASARLRILVGHLPLYPVVESKNKPGEVIASADSSLAFFRDNKIDLYISGHQHAYYPARKNGVRLLNAGAIGDGPRKIMGHDEAAKKAFTIIEIPVKSAAGFSYKTFMPGTNSLIDPQALPDSVAGFNGVLMREDKL